jgi:IS30 family transposase
MPHGYRHLTYEQRCQIYALKKSGKTQAQIAKFLKISQSTISKELKRNIGKRGYRYKQANNEAIQRRSTVSSVRRKMTPYVISFVEKEICENQLSPEQISGILKLRHAIDISHESIYQYIWKDKKQGGKLYKKLRRCGKKYNKRGALRAGRGMIPNRKGIECRPTIVDMKIRVGDYEVDTIVGANHRGAIVSIVERKTKVTFLGLVSGTKADETANVIIERLKPIELHTYTITSDNGKEFAKHESIAEALAIDFYFAQPYHSWERGLNENTNGLVRQYFPKGFDFTKLTEEQVLVVEEKLNNQPRKTLGYKTPNEEFTHLTSINLKKIDSRLNLRRTIT